MMKYLFTFFLLFSAISYSGAQYYKVVYEYLDPTGTNSPIFKGRLTLFFGDDIEELFFDIPGMLPLNISLSPYGNFISNNARDSLCFIEFDERSLGIENYGFTKDNGLFRIGEFSCERYVFSNRNEGRYYVFMVDKNYPSPKFINLLTNELISGFPAEIEIWDNNNKVSFSVISFTEIPMYEQNEKSILDVCENKDKFWKSFLKNYRNY